LNNASLLQEAFAANNIVIPQEAFTIIGLAIGAFCFID
jgi:hypothetical protein